MTHRNTSWLLLILAAICSAVATAAGGRLLFDTLGRGSPVAIVPAVVELGDHEHGKTVTGRLTVANSGTADLLLDRFATTCSCAAVEIESDGQLRRAGSVRVRPGGQVELIARVAVAGRPGTSQQVYVSFATNDPQAARPMVELVVGRVKGGVTTSPLALVLGEQPIGSALKRLVRVYDNGVKGRQLSSVRSLNPDRFSATLLPPASEKEQEADEPRGKLIGVIEVIPVTNQVGSLDGRIEVRVADETRPPDHIEVLGRVVGPMVTRPDSLVLPRTVGGQSVYEGRVTVSARDGSPVAVTPSPAPPGWSISVTDDPGTPGGRAVLVSRTSATQPAEGPFVIRLSATLAGGKVETVEVPVLTRRGDP
jgi:hypothetical protein